MGHSGRSNQGPVLYGVQVADMASAQNAIIGILAALNKRNQTGEGSFVDVSILDSVIPYNTMAGAASMMENKNETREGNSLNGGSLYDFYQTKDGKYYSFGALEPKFFETFCKIIGKEEWMEAGCVCEDYKEKKKELADIFRSKARAEWEEILKDADCCVEPVLELNEVLLASENTVARESVKTVEIAGEKVKVYNNPIKFK